MKQALSLLTAFTLLQMQTWALSGGPVYPTGAPNQAGNYSGVFTPKETRFNLGGLNTPDNSQYEPTSDSSGKIGVFTVDVPVTGLATGDAVIFLNGSIFSGTITGVADPDSSTFDAILELAGAFDIVTQPEVRNPVTGAVIIPEETATPLAHGQMNCKIVEKSTTPQPGRTDTSVGNAARMTGKMVVSSFIFVDSTGRPVSVVDVRFSVSGYRQDTTALP